MENRMLVEIRECLQNRLVEFEGITAYGADMGYELLQHEVYAETMTHSPTKASQWIQNNFNYIGEIYNELISNIGGEEAISNPFVEPEAFMLKIYTEVASYMLSRCDFIDKNWTRDITLTSENINIIANELDMLDLSQNLYDIKMVSFEEQSESEEEEL